MLMSLGLLRNTRLFIRPLSTAKLMQCNDLGFKNTYSPEDTARILNAVNNFTFMELKNYSISQMRIQKILARRDKHGKFKNLEDILELDGFGIKILEKFCFSVIHSPPIINQQVKEQEPVSEEMINSQKISQFITPALIEVARNSVQSIVSFHIDLNFFAWTKIFYNRVADEQIEEPKFVIEDWNCYKIGNEDKKFRLSDLIQLIAKLEEHIPAADMYVMEQMQAAVIAQQPGSALQINVNIQKMQLMAMLCAVMSMRKDFRLKLSKKPIVDGHETLPYIDTVYFLRTNLAARLYKTYVGNEKVSSERVVEEILKLNAFESREPENPTHKSIHIPYTLVDYWKSVDGVQREYLGQSLLLGISFFKLCVQRCNKCIALLNRPRKN